MTDKEIIKALECLGGNETLCLHCAYDPCEFPRCKENVAQDALRLITCQKSQIEDLSVALYERLQRIKELEVEVERLNHCVKTEDEVRAIMKAQMSSVVREVTAERFDTAMEIAKTAAIRAFAERLKAYFITPAQTKIDTEIVELIETLVKEMTEGTNNDGK